MILKWLINLLILYAAWRWLIKPLVLPENSSEEQDEVYGEYIDYEEIDDDDDR